LYFNSFNFPYARFSRTLQKPKHHSANVEDEEAENEEAEDEDEEAEEANDEEADDEADDEEELKRKT
jgi:hypothetical protein